MRAAGGIGATGCAILALALAALHTFLVWGHVTAPTGDYGVWLHQLERAAAGDVPNRDFYFGAPPLSLWLLVLPLRFLGTDLADVWTITATLFLGTLALYGIWVARVVPPALRLPTVLVSGIAGIGYSSWQSASLPMGSYQPSVLVGLFFLILTLLALALQRERLDAWGTLLAALVGASAAASALSKHDYWAPALAAVVASSLSAKGPRTSFAAPLACGVVVAGGLLRLGLEVGFDKLDAVATGFGMSRQWGVARGLPSWKILVAEATATVGWCTLIALGARTSPRARTRRWLPAALLALAALALGALYVGIESRSLVALSEVGLPEFPTDHQARGVEAIVAGSPPAVAAARNLAADLLDQALPVWVPAICAAALWLRRKSLAAGSFSVAFPLAVIALASHGRRGFEHTDAMSALLDVPAIVAGVAALFGARAPRVLAPVFAGSFGLGLVASFVYGAGPGTRVGRQPAFETERGVIHCKQRMGERLVWLTEQLDARDPSRSRPPLELGHNGSIAYFTGRANPTPITVGFTASIVTPEEAAARVRSYRPPFFLVYDSRYEGAGEPRFELDLTHWERQLQANMILARDLAVFERLSAGCREVARLDDRLRLYDCAEERAPGT